VIRCLFALALGGLAGTILGQYLSDDPFFRTMLPVCVALSCIGFTLVLIAKAMSASGAVDPRAVQAAKDAGRTALARVVRIAATGSSVNDQPVCDIELLVTPRSGHGPYRTTMRQLVNQARLPSMQPGAVLVVTQLDPERPEVVLDDAPDPDWIRRAETDTQVRNLSTADVWEAPRGRAPGRLRRIPVVVYPVLFAAGAAGILYPAWDMAGQLLEGKTPTEVRAEAEAAAAVEASMFTPGNLPAAIDAVTALSGTEVTEVGVYEDFVLVTAPTSPGATTTDEWQFRDGEATHEGASSIQPEPEDVGRELFDVDAIDWATLPALHAEAERLLGIDEEESRSLRVAREVWADEKPTAPLVSVSLSDDYYSGWVEFTPNGSVREMSGGAPGSEAAEASE
jgi:hypothetical protein